MWPKGDAATSNDPVEYSEYTDQCTSISEHLCRTDIFPTNRMKCTIELHEDTKDKTVVQEVYTSTLQPLGNPRSVTALV